MKVQVVLFFCLLTVWGALATQDVEQLSTEINKANSHNEVIELLQKHVENIQADEAQGVEVVPANIQKLVGMIDAIIARVKSELQNSRIEAAKQAAANTQKVQSLTATTQTLNAQVQDGQRQISSARDRVLALEINLKTLEDNVKQFEATKKNVGDRLALARSNYNTRKTEIELAIAETRDLVKLFASIGAQLNDVTLLEQNSHALEEAKATLAHQAVSDSKVKSFVEGAQLALELATTAPKADTLELQGVLDKLRSEMESYLNQLERDLNNIRSDFNNIEAALSSQLTSVEHQLKTSDQDKANKMNEVAKLRTTISNLDNNIRDINGRLAGLQKELQAAQQEATHLQQQARNEEQEREKQIKLLEHLRDLLASKDLRSQLVAVKTDSIKLPTDGFAPKGIFKITKGNKLQNAADIPFTGAWSYMFWIRALGTQGDWSNVFWKGDRQENRNPAVWFYPGSTQLHVRSGSPSNWNDGCDPSYKLPIGKWTHVAITHGPSGLRVYVDGVLGCSGPNTPPIKNDGSLWASGAILYPSADGELADFRAVSRVLEAEEIRIAFEQKVAQGDVLTAPLNTILKNPIKLAQSLVVRADKDLPITSTTYFYSFWVRPLGTKPDWSNIFQKGDQIQDRNPAVWFYPGLTRLHVRSGIAGSWNEGCDPSNPLPLNHWTHVAINHDNEGLKVYVNGKLECTGPKAVATKNNGALRISDTFYEPANAEVSDFRIGGTTLTAAQVETLFRSSTPGATDNTPAPGLVLVYDKPAKLVRNKLALPASEIPWTGQYSYAFWIRPLGTQNEWSNVFHKGGADVERSPAVWLYPGSTKIHIRSSVQNNWNAGCDPNDPLPLNQWTHVGFVHINSGLSVYVNGKLACTDTSGAPLKNSGNLNIAGPFHIPANAEIATFYMSARALSASEIQDLATKSP